jgi:hypothetical protein
LTARGHQTAFLADLQRPAAPQQCFAAGAHQLDEAAALDRDVERIASRFHRALLVDQMHDVRAHARARFR